METPDTDTSDMTPIARGPGHRGRRLLKAAQSRSAQIYEYAVAALIQDLRDELGWTYRQIAEDFLLTGVRSFRGRGLSPQRLWQIRNRFKNPVLDVAEEYLGRKNTDEHKD